jgi:flagellin-like protein
MTENAAATGCPSLFREYLLALREPDRLFLYICTEYREYTGSYPARTGPRGFKAMAISGNEEAVSPVIGVILMVAITVIIAAVIAAFVFGMAGSVQKSKMVAASAVHKGTTIHVTFNGGQDQDQVTALVANIGGTDVPLGATVGSTAHLGSFTGSLTHVTVTATFSDGTEQVIMDTLI